MSDEDEIEISGSSLSGAQRSFLRGKAHVLRPVVQVGQSGVTTPLVAAVNQALLDHELIKVRLYRPENKKALAAELAEKTGAHLCGLIGHTVILYRPHPEKPRIRLP
jgi:RNA-binding protein